MASASLNSLISVSRPIMLALSACALGACGGGSLDSQNGPATGMVSGLVCQDVATLSAAVTVPASQGSFISEGKCVNLRAARVNFMRTVTMPGDGQYSQFEYEDKGKTRKLWIKTVLVRPA